MNQGCKIWVAGRHVTLRLSSVQALLMVHQLHSTLCSWASAAVLRRCTLQHRQPLQPSLKRRYIKVCPLGRSSHASIGRHEALLCGSRAAWHPGVTRRMLSQASIQSGRLRARQAACQAPLARSTLEHGWHSFPRQLRSSPVAATQPASSQSPCSAAARQPTTQASTMAVSHGSKL